jgi:glutamate synthase (NADPH/NADH)
MTHRGATGADSRDGDGAGLSVGIPHAFFVREAEREIGVKLPVEGEYGTGNLFFRKPVRPDWFNEEELKAQQKTFSTLADQLGLRLLGWRLCPTDGTILGPASLSREPLILQPFVVLKSRYGGESKESEGNGEFDEQDFERLLYVLRKQSTHTLKLETGFYPCSLSSKVRPFSLLFSLDC